MTLYLENAVSFPESGAISTNCIWHSAAPMLAIASYFQEKGGFVTVFDELVYFGLGYCLCYFFRIIF